jgi:ankyrin repeat protein
LLLKHKADPNAVGLIHDTSMSDRPLIQLFYRYGDYSKPLSSTETKILHLLLSYGANVNSRVVSGGLEMKNGQMTEPEYEGATPLMFAALAGDMPNIQYLLKRGANLKLRDGGNTALDYARREKRVAAVKILQAAMRKP